MVKLQNMIIIGLVVLFFSRFFQIIFNLPSIINFLHFIIFIPLFFLYLNKKQIKKKLSLFILFCSLFLTIIISTLLNNAGVVNLILDLFLLLEPFLFLHLLTILDTDSKSVSFFGKWIIFLGIIQIPFGFFQAINFGKGDFVKGTLLGMGAGHHVLGAIVLLCALYLFFSKYKINILWKYSLIFSLLLLILLSDSKQVVLGMLGALFVFIFIKLDKPKEFIKFFLIICILGIIAYYGLNIVHPNGPFTDLSYWNEGLTKKMEVFPVINSHHESIFNSLFGLGPGHTVSRLAFMLPDYYDILGNFGATIDPLTNIIWELQQSNYRTNSSTGSSVFSLFFSWAGIFGDIGLIGILIYFFILIYIYRNYCPDDLSKLILILIMVFGFIFGWMEEPNFMLYSLAIIGQRFREFKLNKKINNEYKRY